MERTLAWEELAGWLQNQGLTPEQVMQAITDFQKKLPKEDMDARHQMVLPFPNLAHG
jgi:hypothetical protein